MLNKPKKGFSFLIRPLVVGLDLITLCLSAYYLLYPSTNYLYFGYLMSGWLVGASVVKFYEVYRFTTIVKILGYCVKQSLIMFLLVFAYLGIVKLDQISAIDVIRFVSIVMLIISINKFLVYTALRKYRLLFNGNNRSVLVIGNSKQTKELVSFFNKKKNLGYHISKIFTDDESDNFDKGFEYLKENRIDEVYCAINENGNDSINDLVNYCESNGIVLKFVPDVEHIPVTHLHTDYYDYIPVLSVPKMPLHFQANIILKRMIDIILSSLVIISILSWLTPLLFIIIKLESKGPLFFIHKRNGVNYGEFWCYKFRSLKVQKENDKLHVSKEDNRVTKVGRFLRKTSIDELPQFVNVLLGDMSIVGPRPHIPRYTDAYAQKIDKFQFVFRHSVRPGITGLAQVKGYRGEVQSDADIIGRVRHDVFYIENWSLLMDFKIIFDTFILLFKGQEKAY